MASGFYVIPSIEKWCDRAYEDNESAIKALGTSDTSLEFSRKYYE